MTNQTCWGVREAEVDTSRRKQVTSPIISMPQQAKQQADILASYNQGSHHTATQHDTGSDPPQQGAAGAPQTRQHLQLNKQTASTTLTQWGGGPWSGEKIFDVHWSTFKVKVTCKLEVTRTSDARPVGSNVIDSMAASEISLRWDIKE